MKQPIDTTDDFLAELLNRTNVSHVNNGKHDESLHHIIPTKDSKSSTHDFLLAEFNNLQQRAAQLEQLKSSSINFFLLIVAAVATGIPALASTINDVLYMKITLTTAPLLLFFFGILTLNNSIDYSVAAIAHLRRAGRIRRWFVELDSSIGAYVPWDPADNRPKIYIPRISFRGSEVSVFFINTINAALSVSILLANISFMTSIESFAITTIIIWFAQKYFVTKKLQNAEVRDLQNVHFPYQGK